MLVDVSGSMYRFNGVDGRLERSMEAVCMVMEALESYEHRFKVSGALGLRCRRVGCATANYNFYKVIKVIWILLFNTQCREKWGGGGEDMTVCKKGRQTSWPLSDTQPMLILIDRQLPGPMR